jgi:hypothetical protein
MPSIDTMLVSQPRAQITKPMSFFSDKHGPWKNIAPDIEECIHPIMNFPGWMLRFECRSFNNERGRGFNSRVGPVMSFLQAAGWCWHTKSRNPECRIIGVTSVNSRMVDYDLAVKLTSGLFRSARGRHRPDTTVIGCPNATDPLQS